MSSYRTDSPVFPWLSHQNLDGIPFVFMMVGERSVNWYGQPDVIEANREYLNLITPGCRVMDVGANEGYMTILAALKSGPSGRVMAFEPAPHNLQPLKINITLNGLGGRVDILEKAVSDSSTGIEFFGEAATSGGGRVPAIALDEFIDFAPDLIKCDVEGAELKVMRGAANLLKKYRPVIFLETHLDGESGGVDMRSLGDQPEDLYKLMTELGYVFYKDGNVTDVLPSGACILRHKDGPRKFRSLIYTVAFGEDYQKCAEKLGDSLRAVGYAGDFRIYGGHPGATHPVNPASLPDHDHWQIAARLIIGSLVEFNDYDVVMHMDADTLVIQPIDELLGMAASKDSVHRFTEMDLNDENRKYFLAPNADTTQPRGFSGSIFAGRPKEFQKHCKAVLDKCYWIDAWKLPCQDQNAVNLMVANNEIVVHEWPKEWAHFGNDGCEPVTAATKVIHFTDVVKVKLRYMKTVIGLISR